MNTLAVSGALLIIGSSDTSCLRLFKFLGVVALFSLHMILASASDDCVSPFGVQSHDPSDDSAVFCEYRLCRQYADGQIPSSYYQADLTNDTTCSMTGGDCNPTWSFLSVLKFNESMKEAGMQPWSWQEMLVKVSFVCKSPSRASRDTKMRRFAAKLRPLVQRNATCWQEKIHQLLSSGEAGCARAGQGPERCCASKHSH